MKRAFNLVLAIIIILSVSVSAVAAGCSEADVPQNVEGSNENCVSVDETVEYVEGFWRVEDGVVRPITKEELDEIWVEEDLGNTFDEIATDNSNSSAARGFDHLYFYTNVEEVETKVYQDLSQELCAWHEFGPAGGSFNITQEKTFGREYSLNITTPEIRSVTTAIGASWSVTTSTAVGSTMNAMPNTTARLRYAPECTRYDGTLEHRSWNYDLIETNDLTVYQPTTHNNGLYYIEYR